MIFYFQIGFFNLFSIYLFRDPLSFYCFFFRNLFSLRSIVKVYIFSTFSYQRIPCMRSVVFDVHKLFNLMLFNYLSNFYGKLMIAKCITRSFIFCTWVTSTIPINFVCNFGLLINSVIYVSSLSVF